MRTNLSCCLGLIDNGQHRGTYRLLPSLQITGALEAYKVCIYQSMKSSFRLAKAGMSIMSAHGPCLIWPPDIARTESSVLKTQILGEAPIWVWISGEFPGLSPFSEFASGTGHKSSQGLWHPPASCHRVCGCNEETCKPQCNQTVHQVISSCISSCNGDMHL